MTPSEHSKQRGREAGCQMIDRDGGVCGEPVMVGKVCYDHAVLHPVLTDEPMCPITCTDEEFDHYNHGRLLRGQLPMLRGRWS